MAVSKQEVILEFNADTSGVEQSIGKVEQGVENTSQATSGLTNQLDKMTGGAVTGFRNMTKGVKTAVTGMKSLKVAIAATGIGLLVVAIASLVAYFQSTERGAQKLRKITAVLGAVMDKLKDVAVFVGEALFEAFSNPKEAVMNLWETIKTNIVNRLEGFLEFLPAIGRAIKQVFEGDFEGAAKTAADAVGKVTLGVEGITDKMAEAAKAAGEYALEIARVAKAAEDLANRENDLKVAEREFLQVRADTNKLIAEKRLLVEDEKMAMQDRIAALDEAIAAEQRTIAQELEFAKERADILEAKSKLAESDEETLQEVAEARARVTELETSSLKTQKRLEGERQSLLLQAEARAKQLENAEIARKEKLQKAEEERIAKELEATIKANEARANLEDELFRMTLSQQEQEELAIMEKFDQRIAIAGDDEGLIRMATEQLNADLLAIEQKYLDQEKALQDKAEKEAEKRDKDKLARERELANQKVELTKSALGALQALNDAFSKSDEKGAKKAFQRNKALALATATVNTGQAVVNALTAGGNPIKLATGAQFVEAAIAATTGAAQIATIAKSQFSASGGGGDTAPVSSGAGAGADIGGAPQAPQLDLSFLGGGAGGQAPLQAYVIASDVSNAQQANQQIQDQATL